MGNLSLFLKKNKVKKENVKFAATKSLTDETGNALEWELRALTSKEDNDLREECTREVQVTGKPNVFRPKFNSGQYLKKVAARCVVLPDLNNKELQDSYEVMCAEELVQEMIDDAGEFNVFMSELNKLNGFTETFQDKVNEAKN